MSIDKFMKAIEDVTSFIGYNNDHWGTITMVVDKRSGNERREQIKKVPKNVKAKRKSTARRK
jgi:hypothetical protein